MEAGDFSMAPAATMTNTPPANGSFERISSNAEAMPAAHDSRYPHQMAPDAIPTPPIPLGKKRAKRRRSPKEESASSAFCAWIMDHQIGIAMNLMLLLAMTHISFPRARRQTRKFFELQYYDPETGRYNIGWDDAALVCFWTVVLTGLRVAAMEYLFHPLAELVGVTRKKSIVRFSEQAWMMLYCSSAFALGMYIMRHSSYWLNLAGLWANWPQRQVDGILKWYYLVQYAFWLHQILVVNIEERRKDHWQMFTHHIVTCCLIFTSYGYHYRQVGNLILCLMDQVDIFLALAKMLNYMNKRRATDTAFGIFMLVWFGARHVAYPAIVASIFTELLPNQPIGCYEGPAKSLRGPFEVPDGYWYLIMPFIDPSGIICLTRTTMGVFVSMLLFLQVIFFVWFAMILGVVWRVIRGKGAEDSRSDDEDSDSEDLEADGQPDPLLTKAVDVDQSEHSSTTIQRPYIEVWPIEEEVGVEALSLSALRTSPGNSSPARRQRKTNASSSGVTLPHDRKELLGRIGCDKSTSP